MATRRAEVKGRRLTREGLERYLPGNYFVAAELGMDLDGMNEYIIEGEDNSGWTMENYVIPRLASGLIWAKEIK